MILFCLLCESIRRSVCYVNQCVDLFWELVLFGILSQDMWSWNSISSTLKCYCFIQVADEGNWETLFSHRSGRAISWFLLYASKILLHEKKIHWRIAKSFLISIFRFYWSQNLLKSFAIHLNAEPDRLIFKRKL